MAGRSTFGATLGVVTLAIAGCGGGGGSSSASSTSTQPAPSAGAGSSLSLQADPSGALRFNKKTLTAKAGKVTIVMRNPSSVSHDVSVEGQGVNVHGAVVGHGGTSTVAATLKPGTYTFYCSVPGHRQAGMVGTLTVH
jgi:uncharacterized cupredoxin-like copper-binding protein